MMIKTKKVRTTVLRRIPGNVLNVASTPEGANARAACLEELYNQVERLPNHYKAELIESLCILIGEVARFHGRKSDGR